MKIKLISKLVAVLFAGAAFSCFNSSACVSAMEQQSNIKAAQSQASNKNEVVADKVKKIEDFELEKLKINPRFIVDSLNKVKTISRTNEQDLNNYADLMFDKINEFLEKIKSLNEKGWFNYVRNYVSTNSKNGKKQIVTQNAKWFKQHENDSNYLILTTGVDDKESAQSLREGHPPIDPKDDDYSGKGPDGEVVDRYSGFTPNSLHCQPFLNFSYRIAFSKGSGEVVKLALSKDSKLIDNDYLDEIFLKMFERYSEELADILPDMTDFFGTIWYSLKPDFKVLVDFVKKKTGFDFYSDVFKKSLHKRFQELCVSYLIIYGIMRGDSFKDFEDKNIENKSFIEGYRKACGEFSEEDKAKVDKINSSFLPYLSTNDESGFRNEQKKIREKIRNTKYGSKLWNFMLLKEFDCLLAKMLGFDGYYIGYSNSENISNFNEIPGGEIGLSDFSNLIVCSDEFDVEEEISKLK